MSIIQTIQEKYAKVMAVIIALALIIFVVMLAFENGGSLFSGGNTVGRVAGKKITAEAFNHKVQAYQRNNQQGGEMATAQAVEQAWNEVVDSVILAREYEKLGLAVTDKEINNLIFSQNAPQEIRQIFADPQTGAYDPNFARQQFNQVKKQGSPEQKQYLNALVDYMERRTLEEKYTALLSNTISVPKWFVEKRNVDQSLMAKLSYVAVPYSTISDSTVKVSDDDIRGFIKDHPSQFEQKEETRSISYVAFSAAPSAADSAAARKGLLELKAQFDTVTVYKNFVERNSTLPLYEGYISKNAMQQPNKDSILSQRVGTVYGPYLDATNYTLSKVYASAPIHDTVTVRHILIATQQQGQDGTLMPVREDSAAKKIADSVQLLFRTGTSFDSLVARYSEDPGSKNNGGKYENITTGRMVPPFNDFIFTQPVGATGLVKTDFGYHFIEVLSAKGSSTGYKVAYLSRPITASDETEASAQNAAQLFAGDSRNEKAFNDNWEKSLRTKGINKLTATDIKPVDFTVQGLNGASRKLVRDIFEADKGDVVGPEKVGDAFVVATVTDINKKGEPSLATLRPMIEPLLRNKKKAEQIIKNIGKPASLDAVAQKTAQQVATADSVRFAGGSVLGYEPKVSGAAFDPSLKGKAASEPIAGQAGVYVIRVENTYNTSVAVGSVDEQRKQLEMQARQQLMSQMQYGGGNPFTSALRKAAKVEDNRARFW